jgi:hypothetical protein
VDADARAAAIVRHTVPDFLTWLGTPRPWLLDAARA